MGSCRSKHDAFVYTIHSQASLFAALGNAVDNVKVWMCNTEAGFVVRFGADRYLHFSTHDRPHAPRYKDLHITAITESHGLDVDENKSYTIESLSFFALFDSFCRVTHDHQTFPMHLYVDLHKNRATPTPRFIDYSYWVSTHHHMTLRFDST